MIAANKENSQNYQVVLPLPDLGFSAIRAKGKPLTDRVPISNHFGLEKNHSKKRGKQDKQGLGQQENKAVSRIIEGRNRVGVGFGFGVGFGVEHEHELEPKILTRKNSNISATAVDRLTLLEKKKNYAQSIRERNMKRARKQSLEHNSITIENTTYEHEAQSIIFHQSSYTSNNNSIWLSGNKGIKYILQDNNHQHKQQYKQPQIYSYPDSIKEIEVQSKQKDHDALILISFNPNGSNMNTMNRTQASVKKQSKGEQGLRSVAHAKIKGKKNSQVISQLSTAVVNKKCKQPQSSLSNCTGFQRNTKIRSLSTSNLTKTNNDLSSHIPPIEQESQPLAQEYGTQTMHAAEATLASKVVQIVITPTLDAEQEAILQEQLLEEKVKQLQLLHKQNQTYRKEISLLRKDNIAQKRTINQHKKEIDTLNQNIKAQLSVIQQVQQKYTHTLAQLQQSKKDKIINTKQEKKEKEEDQIQNQSQTQFNLYKMLQQHQWTIQQLKQQCTRLGLKNHVLQKRLADESQVHRKMIAKEISSWREKCTKLRQQNMKLKGKASDPGLFQMSISLDDIPN